MSSGRPEDEKRRSMVIVGIPVIFSFGGFIVGSNQCTGISWRNIFSTRRSVNLRLSHCASLVNLTWYLVLEEKRKDKSSRFESAWALSWACVRVLCRVQIGKINKLRCRLLMMIFVDVLASSFGQIIFSFQLFRESPIEQKPKRKSPLDREDFFLVKPEAEIKIALRFLRVARRHNTPLISLARKDKTKPNHFSLRDSQVARKIRRNFDSCRWFAGVIEENFAETLSLRRRSVIGRRSMCEFMFVVIRIN